MKSKEELTALKEELKTVKEKLSALTREELEQVTGGSAASCGAFIDTSKCIQCGTCLDYCPTDAISYNGTAYVVGAECIGCETCACVCPGDAITVWR